MNKARRARLSKIYDGLDEIQSELVSIHDEEQEAREAIPERLQETERATAMEDNVQDLETLDDDLESLKSTLMDIMNRR